MTRRIPSSATASPHGTFIGRSAELLALGRVLRDGRRLVTVTGSPGIGKTRLVRQLAASSEACRFYVCDLTEAKTVDDACAVVARVIRAPIAAGASTRDGVEQIGRALAKLDGSVLVLDNVEQLAPVSHELLVPWMEAAGDVQFVATSRERLRLEHEVALALDPLDVDDSMRLFAERARRARADEGGAPNDATLRAIVTKLEGIPLAIELCAARASVLSAEQMLTRLSRRFELLGRGTRGAPSRHATLRGALDWSWELLDETERRALAQCSVFRGSFSVAAAEAVLALPDDVPCALDVLQSLHEKSLVSVFDASPALPERRYRLLESVREYAAERLRAAHEEDAALDRLAAFFLDDTSLERSAAGRLPIAGLALDADNLLSVCARFAAREPFTSMDASGLLAALLILEPVLLLSMACRLEPYTSMLDRALSVEPPPSAGALFARGHYTRALTDLARGRMMDAFGRFQRALEVARASGATAEASRALTKLGLMLEHAVMPERALACFEEARTIAFEAKDPSVRADWLICRGTAFLAQARPNDTLGCTVQALSIFEAIGDVRGRACANAQAALALVSLGRADEAEHAALTALALLEETEDYRARAYALSSLGRANQIRGRFVEASDKLEEALAIHRGIGDRWCEGLALGYRGDVAFEDDRAEDARVHYRAAVTKLEGAGDGYYSAVFAAALVAAEAWCERGGWSVPPPGSVETVTRMGRPNEQIIVDLHRATAALGAHQRSGAGAIAADDSLHVAASAAIARARSQAADGGPGPSQRSEDVRFATRLLESLLARASTTSSCSSSPPPIPALVVGPEARWFGLRDSTVVHLPRSRALRLVLFALARNRIHRPGAALSTQQLIVEGWPGERIHPKAAANRLYVTLTKLRRLGLADILQSRDDGFLLDPNHLVLEAAPQHHVATAAD
ncbi:MAG: AAA family ATPase [Polyangiaceae bacterium]|nr:AAA family ATPase [Polyangiaceae bacterium]